MSSRRMPLLSVVIVAWAAVLLVALPPAAAQNVLRIAAVVNEDVISVFDVINRMKLIIATTGVESSAETQQRLTPQVLRNLIDERLQLQEAQRMSISVTDREIERAVANIEQRNNIPSGQLEPNLTQQGVDPKTLRDRLRAQIAWSRVVNQRFGPTVTVGEEEVNEELRRLEAQRDQPHYRVAEIFLSVNQPDEDTEVRRSAERLIEQIRGGASFSALAREFSETATAAVGGDLGWVTPGQLNPVLQESVTQLQPGQLVGPIRSPSGYHVLLLIERRIPASEDEPVYDLRQVVLPLAENAPQQEVARQMAVAQRLRSTAQDCQAMERAAETVGSPQADRGGQVRLSQLPPEVRAVIQDLPDHRVSEPLRTQGSFILFMVCNREAQGAPPLPDRNAIEARLKDERLDLHAQRYLRELRRTAFLDVRG